MVYGMIPFCSKGPRSPSRKRAPGRASPIMEYQSFQTTEVPPDPVKIQSGSSQDETWELVPVGSLKVRYIFFNNGAHTNTSKDCVKEIKNLARIIKSMDMYVNVNSAINTNGKFGWKSQRATSL